MIMTIIIPRGSDCKNDHHNDNNHYNYNAIKIIILPHLRFYNWAKTDVGAKEGEEARCVGWIHWGAESAEHQ